MTHDGNIIAKTVVGTLIVTATVSGSLGVIVGYGVRMSNDEREQITITEDITPPYSPVTLPMAANAVRNQDKRVNYFDDWGYVDLSDCKIDSEINTLLGDLDGDKDLDLIVACTGSAGIVVYENRITGD